MELASIADVLREAAYDLDTCSAITEFPFWRERFAARAASCRAAADAIADEMLAR